MTDLLAELRRSPAPADAQVADLLGALRPARAAGTPRASEPLAAFLAAAQTGGTTAPAPRLRAGEPDLVVVLAAPPAAQPAHRSRAAALVGTGLWVKAALGAVVAAAAVAAVVATGPAPDVVVRPSHTPATAPHPSTAPQPGLDDGAVTDPVPRAQHAPPLHAERPRRTTASSAHRPSARATAATGPPAVPVATGRDPADARDDDGGGAEDSGGGEDVSDGTHDDDDEAATGGDGSAGGDTTDDVPDDAPDGGDSGDG